MILLRIRHWQIFLIAWGPLTAVLITLFNLPDLILAYFPIVLGLFLIGLANSFAWVWIIVKELKKLVPSLKTKLFNFAFWIPFTYIWTFIVFMLYNLFIHKVKTVNAEVEIVIVVGMALLSLCCIIYGLIFIGRLIKSIELDKQPSIKDHAAQSILMLFPPIGVWIIQPKLNKIIANQDL